MYFNVTTNIYLKNNENIYNSRETTAYLEWLQASCLSM